MLKINHYFIKGTCITMLLFIYQVFSFAQNPTNKQAINLKTYAMERDIYIRWVPTSFEAWELANSNGYTITRFTIERDREALPEDQIENSKEEHLLNAESLEQLKAYDKNPLLLAAAAIYAPNDFEVTGFNGSPLVKAYQQQQNKQSRMDFTILSAGQDFEYAEKLALGYHDTNIAPNEMYRYIVNINGLNKDEATRFLPGIIDIDMEKALQETVPSLGLLTPDIADKAVTLKWNKPPDAGTFVSFNIYRRELGRSYTKRNEYPYFFSEDGTITMEITYPDELPDNTTTFEYFIGGVNDFGFDVAYTSVARVKGRPKPIEQTPFILTTSEDANKNVNLTWEFPVAVENRIAGFKILRAVSREASFQVLSTQIAKNIRTFQDPNPLPSAYYMVVAKDLNDYDINSVPKLAQLIDNEEPIAPINLRGTIDLEGNVTMKWDNNQEPDLMGYVVFLSNNRDDEYVLISKDWTAQPLFDNYNVNIKTLAHKVYMKVAALDFHHNRSELSQPCELLIPDIIPPANPVLDSVVCSLYGNKVTWRNSFSDDVVKHQLERKATDEEDWFVIHEYPNKRDHFYLDRATLPGKHYCYRLKAIDAAELVSYSTEYCNSCGQGGFAAAQNLVAFLDPDFIKDGTTKDPNMCEDGKPRRRKGIIKVYFEVPDASNIFDFEIMRSIGNTLGGDNDKFMVIDAPQPRDITFTGRYTIKNPDKKGKDILIGLDDTPSNETPKADVPKAPLISTNGEPTGGGTGTGSTSTGGGATTGTGGTGTNPPTLGGPIKPTISKPKPRSKRRAYLFTDKDWETLLCVHDWKKVKYKIRIRYKNGGTSEISLPIVVL